MDKETTKKLFVVCADPRNSLKKINSWILGSGLYKINYFDFESNAS